MTNLAALEKRMDRLESRALIGELCTQYGLACDQRDAQRLAELFTSDVRIRTLDGAMSAHGRNAAIEMYQEMFRFRGPSFHWTHDHVVTFNEDDDDSAEGFVLSHAETTPNGTPTLAGLRYDDHYRRVQGQWLFAERVLSFHYSMPTLDYAARLPVVERVATAKGWRNADIQIADSLWRNRFGLRGLRS